MRWEDALAILGVSADTTKDEIRRAYLRLVKRHKPERDPEGFARVREAYDIASSGLPWGLPRSSTADADATSVGNRPSTTEPPTETPDPPERDAVDPDAAIGGGEEPPLDDEDDATRAADLEELTLYDLADRGDHAAAGAFVIRQLETSLEDPMRGEAAAVEAPWIVASLLAAGEVETARRVRATLDRWLETTGSEARLYHDRSAVLLAVVRELSALPAAFPPPIMKPMAQSLLDGELDDAAAALALVTMHAPRVAGEALAMLRARAPLMERALGHALDPGERHSSVKRTTVPVGTRAVLVAVAVIGLACVRMVVSCADRASPSASRQTALTHVPVRYSEPPAERARATDLAGLWVGSASSARDATDEIGELRTWVERVCSGGRRRLRATCHLTSRMISELEAARCDEVSVQILEVTEELGRLSEPEDRGATDVLDAVVARATRICRERRSR